MIEQLVRLRPWSEDDLALLRQVNTPQMRRHVGGPESEEKLLVRHQRYLALATGQMFRIALTATDEPVGTIGYWDREWHGETVYESGWSVLPEFQGRGIAGAATRAVIEAARTDGRHRWLHAYPGVDNPASNAVCRNAGFELVGPTDFEFPPGSIMRSNDWRYDLHAPTA
jgi:RimJ/RimL family protein N-acetyltransferase